MNEKLPTSSSSLCLSDAVSSPAEENKLPVGSGVVSLATGEAVHSAEGKPKAGVAYITSQSYTPGLSGFPSASKTAEARAQPTLGDSELERLESRYRHRVFSFESTSDSHNIPVDTTVPDHSPLSPAFRRVPENEPATSSSHLPHGRAKSALMNDAWSPEFDHRSCSSEYPTEGIRTPEFTVSPPTTFHRRIFKDILTDVITRAPLARRSLSMTSLRAKEKPVFDPTAPESRNRRAQLCARRTQSETYNNPPDVPGDTLGTSALFPDGLPTPPPSSANDDQMETLMGHGGIDAEILPLQLGNNDIGPNVEKDSAEMGTVKRVFPASARSWREPGR